MRLSDLVREQAPDLPGGSASRQQAEPNQALSLQGSPDTAASLPAQTPACADWYVSAQQEMAKVGALVRANGAVPFDRCASLAADVVKRLRTSDDLIQCMMVGSSDDYQVANAVNVAILSAKIGMGLHYESAALERLALAGLLHDLGMWLVPPGIIEKPGSLNEEEQARVYAHPEEGRRIVAGMGESYRWLATTIAQEHERWDGSGYPCRLKGGDIAESAQIIGLADVFDALITQRPYHARVVPHQALRGLLVQHKQAFQPRLLKTVVDQLSLYPVGTAVRLNDGHIGVVSKVNPRFPLRPVLLVRRSHEGRTTGDPAPLDLSHETSTHIVEVLPATQAA
jgi:HD-GYP domain-containing protein (c-di-GMP phosphodiesterase class II)